MTAEEKNLKEYVEQDEIYKKYKNGTTDLSDFDKFCIEHCKDIETALNIIEKVRDFCNKELEFSKTDCIPTRLLVCERILKMLGDSNE